MSHTPSPASPRTPSAIDAIAEDYVASVIDLQPEWGIHLGVAGREEDYSDYSPAGTAAMRSLLVDTLARLDAQEPVDDVDSVTLDAMRERLGLDVEIIDSGVTSLNNIESVPQSARAIFDLMPQETATDWAHIAGRLAKLPAALEGYRASLDDSRAKGHVPAVRQVDIVVEQIDGYAADGGFFDTLEADGSAQAPGQAEALRKGADAAKAAYRALREYLSDDLHADATEVDAVGREYYSLMSRAFLGAEVDLEETYQWGLDELARIVAEQEAVAEQIEPGASIARAREVLAADESRTLHGTDALKAWMQETSDRALRELAGSHFDIEPPMDRLECMIAPTQEGGIYYTPPTPDFSRAGRMWWSVPEGEDTFQTWAETSTVYHEGVPGHHLQCATAILSADELNRWRRELIWVSGHGEGWALYAERLMEELGYLEDPADRLGMLDGQRLRAARVVFDIGVHLGLPAPAEYGGGTWDADKGWEFLQANMFESEGRIRFEFLRYLGWPGQAPSYKIGQRLWEQIRDEVKAAEGEEFDLKAFHTRALRLGSMGLDSLRRALVRG